MLPRAVIVGVFSRLSLHKLQIVNEFEEARKDLSTSYTRHQNGQNYETYQLRGFFEAQRIFNVAFCQSLLALRYGFTNEQLNKYYLEPLRRGFLLTEDPRFAGPNRDFKAPEYWHVAERTYLTPFDYVLKYGSFAGELAYGQEVFLDIETIVLLTLRDKALAMQNHYLPELVGELDTGFVKEYLEQQRSDEKFLRDMKWHVKYASSEHMRPQIPGILTVQDSPNFITKAMLKYLPVFTRFFAANSYENLVIAVILGQVPDDFSGVAPEPTPPMNFGFARVNLPVPFQPAPLGRKLANLLKLAVSVGNSGALRRLLEEFPNSRFDNLSLSEIIYDPRCLSLIQHWEGWENHAVEMQQTFARSLSLSQQAILVLDPARQSPLEKVFAVLQQDIPRFQGHSSYTHSYDLISVTAPERKDDKQPLALAIRSAAEAERYRFIRIYKRVEIEVINPVVEVAIYRHVPELLEVSL